jgi:hypothetical protein
MSLPSALAPPDDATGRKQRKSVAEGCDAPRSPPIVIHGRDSDLDKKSHGNQTLLKLIRLNLIPHREADYDERASLLVKKIIQQIRDWRGRFVQFNKERNAWKDVPSNEAIALVRGMFDEEVLKRRGKIDSTIQIYPPTQPAIQIYLPTQTTIQRFLENKGMDKDQIEAYWKFTPMQRDKFRKLCQLHVSDVADAVNLIEIPPWLDTAAVSSMAALRPQTLQNETEGEMIGTEACSWVDALMVQTQGSEESLHSRSTTDDDNTPLPDPISPRQHNRGGEDVGFPESDSQEALVKRANFRKLCKLHVFDVEDAVTLIEIPPWANTAAVSPIAAALSPESFRMGNEGENKRRKKSRETVGHVPTEKDADEVLLCESSGERRIRTESCSWVDAPMLATQNSEESLLLRLTTDDNNPPLPDPTLARRHLWGEDTGLPESDSLQVHSPDIDIILNGSPFCW